MTKGQIASLATGAQGPETPDPARTVRLTAPALRALKGRRKIAALTAYDAPTAALLDAAGVDLLLVGDSIEMVVYGAADTLGASLDRMVAHARAVSGSAKRALVVGDLPYLTYHTTPEEAVRNAAEKTGANHQEFAFNGAGYVTDAVGAVLTGMAVVSLALPRRYSHSPVELFHMNDICDTQKTVEEFLKNEVDLGLLHK